MSLHTNLPLAASILATMFCSGCENQKPVPSQDLVEQISNTGAYASIDKDVMTLCFSPESWSPVDIETIARAIHDAPNSPSQVVLEIGQEVVTAKSFRELQKIPELTGLSLIYTQIDEAALAEIAQLDQLTHLHLQDIKLPENYLEAFPHLKNLTSLKMTRQAEPDQILRLLADNTQLIRLQLIHLELTEKVCEAIAAHQSLETLELLEVSTAQDLDASALSMLESLKTLNVTVWSVDWQLDDFALLGRLEQLESVFLRTGLLLDDRVPEALSGLHHLHSVSLWDTEITNVGYQTLMSVESLRHVTLGSSLIDDEGINTTALPENLKSLAVEHSRVTCAGAVELKLPASLESFSINPALLPTAVLKTASPQHQKLLTASAVGDNNSGGLRVWDAKTGDLIMFGASWCAGGTISTTPDEKQIIVCQGLVSTRGQLLFLDADTGGLIKRIPVPKADATPFARVSHSGDRLAVATSESLQLLQLDTGEELFSIPLAAGRPFSLTFSPDDRYLTIGYQHGNKLEIRDLRLEGEVIQTVEGFNPYFSPDSQLVSVTYPAYIYRIGEPKPLAWKAGRFVSDTELLALSSSNVSGYMLSLFDIERQQQTHKVHFAGDHLQPWIVSPDVSLVAKVEAETIEVVDYRTGKVRCVIKAANGMPDPPLVMIAPAVFIDDRLLVGSVSQSFLRCGN